MPIKLILCSFCKSKPATRLCDAPIGRIRYIGHPPRHLLKKAKNYQNAWVKVEMQKVVTCNRPICEECATKVAAGVDFCPTCMERIKTTPTKYKIERKLTL